DFPRVAPGSILQARVVFWQPVNPNELEEDLAGLELESPLPQTAKPIRLVVSENLWGHPFQVFGFPKGQPNGVWASGKLRAQNAKNWVQLEDVKGTGYRLEPGFSGAPIWDEQLDGVAGMAVAAEMTRPDAKAAFIIPTNLIVQAWSELREQAIPPCPYQGLSAFREEDAQLFFGREEFTRQLVAAVPRHPLITIIGPSGSGKSSVVFAGMIPQIRSEANWLIENFRPSERPLHNLAARLVPHLEAQMSETDQLAEVNKLATKLQQEELALRDVVVRILEKNSSTHLLLVADQFEELYTLCKNGSERQIFLDQLLEAVNQASNFTLVLTLRADFLGYALSYRPFADALQGVEPPSPNPFPLRGGRGVGATYLLGPMNREELRQAIEQPARLLGIKIESGLTELILKAVEQEPGNLPLLEFALKLLWEKRKNGQLTHNAYKKIGGVEKALSGYAEEIYEKLSEVNKQRSHKVFIQLVRPGEGTEDTRRLATRVEVGEENWDLVTQLANARLVVTGRNESASEETVEVVHEALIRGWKRLRQWMEDDRSFRTWQEGLRLARGKWKTIDKDEGALLRGVSLLEAEGWLQGRGEELSPTERDFIQASIASRDQEEAERQAKQSTEQANQIFVEAQKQAKQTPLKQGLWRKWEILTALSVSSFVIILRLIGVLQSWEWATLDQLFRLRPLEPTDERIVIVGIDEADIQNLENAIISDKVYAKLLKKLKAQQPRAIGLNIYREFPVEPGYEQLKKVFESTPYLVGIQKVAGEPGRDTVAPPPVLKALGQVGANDVILDADNKVRRGLLDLNAPDGEGVYSLGFYLALLYLDVINISVEEVDEYKISLGKAIFAPLEANDGGYVRTDAGGYQILLNYRGPNKHFQTVSMTEVLEDKLPPDWGRDRIILIGKVGVSFNDIFFTPYSAGLLGLSEPMSGVEVHANLTSQIIAAALDGRPLIKSWSESIELLWILGWSWIGVSLSWRFLRLRSPRLLIFIILLAGVTIVSSCYVAFLSGWWIPLVPPALSFVGSAIVVSLATRNQIEKLQLHRTMELIMDIYHKNPAAASIAIEYLKRSESDRSQILLDKWLQTEFLNNSEDVVTRK
ncbi:MAG: CHASE2 domain-containing protein, partial [Symploca sp. SIO3E6]|nr:CHASE2 domain-containing protein [Caldora sp. SIO3E6]